MKKCLMLGLVAVFLSTLSIGCSSDGSSSSWCRLGSPWPTSRSRVETQPVYLTGAQACNPCEMVSPCNPCEPVCNPCDMSCTGTGVSYGGLLPHPGN